MQEWAEWGAVLVSVASLAIAIAAWRGARRKSLAKYPRPERYKYSSTAVAFRIPSDEAGYFGISEVNRSDGIAVVRVETFVQERTVEQIGARTITHISKAITYDPPVQLAIARNDAFSPGEHWVVTIISLGPRGTKKRVIIEPD